MKNKFNHSLNDEFTTIKDFVKQYKKDISLKWKISRRMWISCAIIIALFNIATLVLTSIAFEEVLVIYFHKKNTSVDSSDIILMALVSIISIFIFILTIIITIYQGRMRSQIYLTTSKTIQRLTIEYFTLSKHSAKNEELFRKKIENIYSKALSSRKKISLKKVLVSILVGGKDE